MFPNSCSTYSLLSSDFISFQSPSCNIYDFNLPSAQPVYSLIHFPLLAVLKHINFQWSQPFLPLLTLYKVYIFLSSVSSKEGRGLQSLFCTTSQLSHSFSFTHCSYLLFPLHLYRLLCKIYGRLHFASLQQLYLSLFCLVSFFILKRLNQFFIIVFRV